jgi:hypothetical protein
MTKIKPDLFRGSGLTNEKYQEGLDISCFILGAQAPRAQFKVFHLAVNHDSCRMNISRPASVGMAFRMADVMTVLWYLAT